MHRLLTARPTESVHSPARDVRPLHIVFMLAQFKSGDGRKQLVHQLKDGAKLMDEKALFQAALFFYPRGGGGAGLGELLVGGSHCLFA